MRLNQIPTEKILGMTHSRLWMTTIQLIIPSDFEHPIDVGGNNQYEVIVQASDGNGGTDTQTISIDISDIEDPTVVTPDPTTPPDIPDEIEPDPDGEHSGDDTFPPLDDDDPIDDTQDTGPFIPDDTNTDEKPVDGDQDEAEAETEPTNDQINEPVELIKPEIDFDLKKFDRRALTAAMDQTLLDLRDHDLVRGTTPIKISFLVGTLLTAGFVTWILRAGAMVSALLTTMPVWRGFDPLLVLISRRSKDENKPLEEDDYSNIDRVFERASKANHHSQSQP